MRYEKFINIYKQYLISEKNLSNNTIKNYLIDLHQFFNKEMIDSKIDIEFEIVPYNDIEAATCNG